MTKFISNDKDTMNSIPVAERAKSFQTVSINGNINEQTLGVKWDVTKDVFTFDTVKVKEEDVTKRNISHNKQASHNVTMNNQVTM